MATYCSGCEMDYDGTGNRELLEALDIAGTRRICLKVANARPGTGTIVFLRIAGGCSYPLFRIYSWRCGFENPGIDCIIISQKKTWYKGVSENRYRQYWDLRIPLD